MPNPLQLAGASLPPSDFAPLHVNRQTTGMWPNTNPLRDASTRELEEKFYGGHQDSIFGGANCEVSTRLTLIRRPGCIVYNNQIFPPINRFYGWNTFTLTDEAVRVIVDTGLGGGIIYDATSSPARANTKQPLFTKSAGAGTAYFLGVGNTLYFTDGVDNMQLNNATGTVTPWGIDAPKTAPTVTQSARPNPYPGWKPNTAYSAVGDFALTIEDPNNYMQRVVQFGVTGAQEPNPWKTVMYEETFDGSVTWQNVGLSGWGGNSAYNVGASIVAAVFDPTSGLNVATLFVAITGGLTGPASPPPNWQPGPGTLVADNEVTWKNAGNLLYWDDIGAATTVLGSASIVDPNGYLQTLLQSGKSADAADPPNWQEVTGAYTTDGSIVWVNAGPYSSGTTAPWLYGYAYASTDAEGDFIDVSNMSPQSLPISVNKGGQVVIQGVGTGQVGVSTIPIYRTSQGGSTFLLLDTIPNPGEGVVWTYIDTHPDSDLNTEIQAQVGGEGTPLPSGATCLAYHLNRIFAAVNNVVYISSGGDAIASGSSGNAGFDTTFTCQSKITRFWVNSLGVVVFTLRDAYLIQGTATPDDPLYITVWVENVPLLHYDAFTVLLATAYLFGGQRMVQSLDPGSGITEASFPIAPLVDQIDPKTAFLTFHSGGSGETALYLSDGQTLWYRMAPTSAPESGLNWSPAGVISGGMSALQSTEIMPGTMALLIGPPAAGGPIRMRDVTVNTDAGTPYPMAVDYNPIVLATPGQLAGLAWMTVKCSAAGNAPTLGVVLDEISGPYESVPRTRQDPTNLPPSETLLSNRHSLLQNQKPVWCQVIKFGMQWPAEDSPDELLTYTIFGQTWQEQRSQ